MAARSPTSFNQYNDETVLYPRQQIITTVPSAVVDDQQFCLDVERLIFADCFPPFSTTSTSYVTAHYHVLSAKAKGSHALTTVTTFYAWASDASNFTVRVDGDGIASTSVTASQTSKVWRAFASGNVVTGEATQIYFRVKRDSGSGTIYFAGAGIFQT